VHSQELIGNRLKPLHICYISQEYPPETGWGGIGSYTYEMAHAFAGDGHRVTVIARAASVESVTNDGGVEVHRVSPSHTWDNIPIFWRLNRIWPGFAWSAMRRLRSVHCGQPIDLVEAAEVRADGFFVSFMPGRPKLVTRLHTAQIFIDHLNRMQIKQTRRWDYWLEKKSILRANLITAPSQAVIDLTLTWLPLRNTPACVIPNAVNERKFLPANIERHNSVLYVSRLERNKGMETIARAIPIVLKRFPSAAFQFVGSDGIDSDGKKWSDKFLDAVDPTQRERLRFEQKSRDALIQAYQEAAVCILPSAWENSPYALLEAMACGTPVIATRAGGVPEIIEDGVNGFMLPAGDAEALADRICALLEDAQLRKALGHNARRRIQELFSVERVLPRMVAAYEAAIRGTEVRGVPSDEVLLSCQPQ
jgi:glycosyltransferase involved in cell wall biosynthesis